MHTVPTDILDALDTLHLPPMPQVLLRFLGAMENERAAKTELATLIKQDPALCARFLTSAHAPQLGNASVFRSVEHCLDALGNRLIQVMSSCLAVQSVFGGDAERRLYGLDGFWTHSLQVAELAQDIAASLHYPEREEAYLAGLLHDVGELLLLGGLGDRYGALLNWSQPELAERCSIHVQTISNFEKESSTPSKNTLSKISITFDMAGVANALADFINTGRFPQSQAARAFIKSPPA